MKGQNKLTTNERKHLKENNIHTLQDMIVTRTEQKRLRAISTDTRELCRECRTIAIKLGIES